MARRILAAIALLSLVLIPATAALAQDLGAGLFTVTENPTLGQILANNDGGTLYKWAGDSLGASACNDACAAAWPPYIVEEGTAMMMMDVMEGPGVIQRTDGTYQAALNGMPLYNFSRDAAPGDANGEGSNGFGARWSVVKADEMMMGM